MVTKKKNKNVKKRKPKGKKLSEALEEKDAKRAEEEADAEAAAAAADDEDDLASEPPPAYDEDDAYDDDEDDVEDDDRDEDGDEDDDVVDAVYGDDDDGDDDGDDDDGDDDDDDDDDELGEDEEWEDDDEEMAAAQMGHQRYVIAGFFGAWMLAGYIIGKTFELIWSRLAAKDWFVESLPQLAAVPHEGDLVSRASISLVIGALVGGGIVLRYYTQPDVRHWADEVAEQLTHVKWPTRKEVGNNTVVVMVASAVITVYLTLLDRFWAFVTNLIYTSGT